MVFGKCKFNKIEMQQNQDAKVKIKMQIKSEMKFKMQVNETIKAKRQRGSEKRQHFSCISEFGKSNT